MVHIEVAENAGVPLAVVRVATRRKSEAQREAARQRDENLLWDEVWSVFDIDEHPNIREAVELAATESIELAISNPCFELWILLHFQSQSAHIERGNLRTVLLGYLPHYVKEVPFSSVNGYYNLALYRAQELDRQAGLAGLSGMNPTTGVYRLTESIMTH